ncbi:MAG: AAA family ATPase [Candidatus Hydrothermarchaeales archaeon]
MRRIGLLYTKGALPFLEGFGNLPTDVVRGDGLVDGKPASKILDMIIIPGGTLVESGLSREICTEIERMHEEGKFILGICSGFQILATKTDIGRRAPTPICKEGLGLLNVEFEPMICTDWVDARAIGKSFLTDGVTTVQGFHAHTYGKMANKEMVILESEVDRLDYKETGETIISGVVNREGNVAGILIHRLLDENDAVLNSVLDALDISEGGYVKIKERNKGLLKPLRSEIGIDTEIYSKKAGSEAKGEVLLIASSNTGSGKTFVSTGIAGVLKKQGLKVNVCKIASDVRDLMPSLYLIKEEMRRSSSIEIGDIGWSDLRDVVTSTRDYDITVIEGVMGLLTGLLKDGVKHPFSTGEIALTLGIPAILVLECDESGIEGSLAEYMGYSKVADALGIEIGGVILNKVHSDREEKEIFEGAGIPVLGVIPKEELGHRGTIPEVEIRLEEFAEYALRVAERYIHLKGILNIAKKPRIKGVDFEDLRERFLAVYNNIR